MNYLTYIALIGATQAKTTLVIDDAKIVSTAQHIEQSVMTEATKPEAIAVAQAVEQELNVAALKIEMGFGKIMRPALEAFQNDLEAFQPGEDCQVHKYYQCLVDNGIADQPWKSYMTTCKEDTMCGSWYSTSSPEEDSEFWDEQDELADKFEDRTEDLFEPIGKSMQNAYVANAANVAKVQQGLGPSLKNILTNYGCDAACLDSVPLDVVTIAQATTYCACPAVVEVTQTMPGRSLDVTKVLNEMGVPETFKKRTIPKTAVPVGGNTQEPTMNLVSSPEVVPQTSYMSSGIMAAAVFAGGYLLGKNKSAKGDDTFTALL